MFLKVSPYRKIQRFAICGNLSPQYIGPFKVQEQVGPMVYKIVVPPKLASVHNVFHVMALRRYVFNPSHVTDFSPLELSEDLGYEKQQFGFLNKRKKNCETESFLI